MLQAARYLAAEKSNGIPPPATQPRQPHATQFASGTKRKLASGPSLETVESFDDLEESSLASLSFVGDTGMLIDSDDLQGTQEPMVVDIKKAPRTTSSVRCFFTYRSDLTYILQTTVMTTDAKVPPAKKVKTASKVKTEQTDLSDTPLASTQAGDGPWVEMIKARSSYRNTDLPPACQDGRWPKVFLPTIYLWAGSQPNLWNISDDALLEAINHIFQVVYPEVKYAPSLQGSVFGVVCSSTIHFSPSHALNFRPINASLSGAAISALPPSPSSLTLWLGMMTLTPVTSLSIFFRISRSFMKTRMSLTR
jgi:hypothetical protein